MLNKRKRKISLDRANFPIKEKRNQLVPTAALKMPKMMILKCRRIEKVLEIVDSERNYT